MWRRVWGEVVLGESTGVLSAVGMQCGNWGTG